MHQKSPPLSLMINLICLAKNLSSQFKGKVQHRTAIFRLLTPCTPLVAAQKCVESFITDLWYNFKNIFQKGVSLDSIDLCWHILGEAT